MLPPPLSGSGLCPAAAGPGRSLKVAHIHSGVRGISSYVLNLYRTAAPRGIEPLVVSSTRWDKARIPVFEPRSILIGGIVPWPLSVREVRERLATFAPDILHHHYPAGRLDFHADRLQRGLGVPMVCTVHMSVAARRYPIDFFMHAYFLPARRHLRASTCFVAISPLVKRQLERACGVPAERVVVIRTGVDTDLFAPRPREPGNRLELLFVGQIMPEKGLDLLIDVVRAVAADRPVRLTIIGKGTLEWYLRRRTRGVSEVLWGGFLSSTEDMAAAYARADVVVVPTRWEEAFSLVPLEAMAAGTAVVASRTGGNTLAVADGETGLLFEPGDGRALAEILGRTEAAAFHEMGRRGRERALARYTIDRFGEKHRSLYENVLRNPANLRQID